MTDTLFLSSADVDDLAEPIDYVAAVRDAYRQIGEGAPAKPRTLLFNRDPAGMLTSYTAILPETGGMGGYTYSAGFGEGDAWFMTPLFDAESGEPLAVLDGASMNPYKTGAAGATAVDALAREDATEIAVIGSGAQARGQLATTATVREFEAVRVFSPTAENREAFADEFAERIDPPVTAVDGASEADAGADVTSMGQYNPNKNELPPELIARATYVPDIRERVSQDAGSFLAAEEAGLVDEDHVAADLGEVVAGEHPGRTSDDEVTVFDSGGTGIETVAAAHMLYERAKDAGRGTTIDFAPASEALTGR